LGQNHNASESFEKAAARAAAVNLGS